MRILGIENVDYMNKNGKHITGFKLHLGYEKDNTIGLAVINEFVKDIGNVQIDDEVELLYNKFGQVVHIHSLVI